MDTIKKISLVNYDPKWINYFDKASTELHEILNNYINKIYHIGSTSIINMYSKPIIDILIEFKNLSNIDQISKLLERLNYEKARRHNIPHISFFTRRIDPDITLHLHLRECGDPQINRHINFKNYLNSNSIEAQAYEQIKIDLIKKYEFDIYNYILGKDKFIQRIDRLAKLWKNRHLDLKINSYKKIWDETEIIKAMEANLNLHMTHFAQYIEQVEFIRVPGYTIVNSGLNDDTFNYVIDLNLTEEEANIKIPEIIQYFANKNLPFFWCIEPSAKPINLVNYLQKYQQHPKENNIGMYLELDNWSSQKNNSNLKIINAKTQEQLQDFALILTNNDESFKSYFSWVFNMLTEEDPIKFYVGYINNKPVTRGMIVYFAQVAGIYYISTAISERKNGYAQILEEYLLDQAKSLGFNIAVLQPAATGLNLHQRIGFKECCIFKEFQAHICLG